MPRPIKCLIVDDSALVRNILSKGLSEDPGIEVVAVAADPFQARDEIVRHNPDVVTLDVEMPRMDGLEFLRRLMPQFPLPVVMVSSLTDKGKQITLDCLDAGAVDFVSKPKHDMARGLQLMLTELRTKIKIASMANVSHWKNRRPAPPRKATAPAALSETTDKVVAIGASTGGTEAIREVLGGLPAMTPGVVVVQHMPPGFTRMFAERMNKLCAMQVKEAEDNDRVFTGRVLIAPGLKHMRLYRSGGEYRVKCAEGERVCGHCPSVEVLMRSVAEHAGGNAVGVMLTGMGHDGADGMAALRKTGARTIAQDEATSVVFGMPREAYARGGAEKLVPLRDISQNILNLLAARGKK